MKFVEAGKEHGVALWIVQSKPEDPEEGSGGSLHQRGGEDMRKFLLLLAVSVLGAAVVFAVGAATRPSTAQGYDPTLGPEIQERILDGYATLELSQSEPTGKSEQQPTTYFTPTGCAYRWPANRSDWPCWAPYPSSSPAARIASRNCQYYVDHGRPEQHEPSARVVKRLPPWRRRLLRRIQPRRRADLE